MPYLCDTKKLDKPNGCDSLRGMTASFVEYFEVAISL